jgi:hypothetical protein
MWSPIKLDFPFYDFSVIYYDFFKDSDEINKKKKTNRCYCSKTVVTVVKPPSKTARGVIWLVLQSSGGKLDRFEVK